ncbi:MAG: AsmA family protein [Nitrospirota bacterium]
MRPSGKRTCKIVSLTLLLLFISSIILAYFYYLDMKRLLISRVSVKATSLMGQKVHIGDISFSLFDRLVLDDVKIENPEGFDKGELLKIKKIHLSMKATELFKGRFYFRDISVHEPELKLMTDKNGNLNISDEFKRFLTKKSSLNYHIDEFSIMSGIFGFNDDAKFKAGNVNISFKNLSSERGAKTLVKGDVSFSGGNEIKIDAWAYLKDEPRRFNINLSSKDFSLHEFRKIFEEYRIDTGKTAIDMIFSAEGDTGEGINLKSEIKIKKAGSVFLSKGSINMILDLDAFLNISGGSFILNHLKLNSGDISSVNLTGGIADIYRKPSYDAEIKIDRLDLSAFSFMKGVKAEGIITSDNIRIKGNSDKTIPEISGSAKLSDASFRMDEAEVKSLYAKVIFSSENEMSVNAEASAEILRAGEYKFRKPAEISLVLNAKGGREKAALSASVRILDIAVDVGKGAALNLDTANLKLRGDLEEKSFSGKCSFEGERMRYAEKRVRSFSGSFGIDYSENIAAIKDIKTESGDIILTTNLLKIEMPSKDRYAILIKGLNASDPANKAEIKLQDFRIHLNTGEKSFSGDFSFSAEKIMFQDAAAGMISGRGKFDRNDFYIEIPKARISGGGVQLAAKGKTARGPFPVTINVKAENIDIGPLSKIASRLSRIPYSISGNIDRVDFRGTMDSANSVNGNAYISAEKLSAFKTDINLDLVKNGFLQSEIKFTGKNLEFKADAKTGRISAAISGTSRGYLEEERTVKIKAALPVTKATDIREALWGIFPDKLLYAGLDGSLASDISIDYGKDGLSINGDLRLKDFMLEGEYGEYSVGPINGKIPIEYSKSNDIQKMFKMPLFEVSEFENLKKYYSKEIFFSNPPIPPLLKGGEGGLSDEISSDGYSRITIGSLNYGFKLMEDINIWLKQEGSFLNISRFSANIFGGRLNGSAVIDISDGLNYRAGILLEGLSLTELCDGIEPIKGYITGRVDGIATLKGSGSGLSGLIGKADFWTYSAGREKTKISREFLEKIGGPSVKAYLGDRRFDRGIMSLYLQNGFVVFKELEISNRNFLGIQDLSVKVAPFNNRISIDHLMWTITEAAQRAKKE